MVQHDGAAFRGVKLDRLPDILRAGVDVRPTDSTIYCADPEKAFGYGNVLMAFRYRDEEGNYVLRSATSQIRPTTSTEEAAERRKLYPHVLDRYDDGIEKLCRVAPTSDARLSYLQDYGFFIPGSPWQALVGIFIYGDADALNAARQMIAESRAVETN